MNHNYRRQLPQLPAKSAARRAGALLIDTLCWIGAVAAITSMLWAPQIAELAGNWLDTLGGGL